MITNFETITEELNETEMEHMRIFIKGIRSKTAKNPIKANEIVRAMNAHAGIIATGKKFTEVRLRKIVNYIRSNAILPLIATSEGYYTSYDKEAIEKQILSLIERARSIECCAEGLQKFIK